MLELRARLPTDRTKRGELELVEDGDVIGGPWPAYGKADNAEAAAQGNPERDPTQPFGDHPAGVYRIECFRASEHGQARRFGPGRFVLEPICGDAARADENGRVGLLIHGGSLDRDGELRATFGCLRIPDAIVEHLKQVHAMEKITTYTCEEMG